MIYRFLTERETNHYLTQLPEILQSYNSRGHRAIGFLSPNEAEKIRNHPRVLSEQLKRFRKIREAYEKTKPKPLAVNDLVRIRETRRVSRFKRGYFEQYSLNFYRVVDISKRMTIPMYVVKDEDSGEVLKQKFYRSQLVRVTGDNYRIDKVLDRRVRRGKEEFLVKWKFFSDQHNSWIPADSVTDTFANHDV